MKTPIPVLVLFGPTASGKTGILFELFNSLDAIQAEIISADSMQVYRGMDIGTAKPSAQERARLPHHLIDICDPSQQFNAGDFVRLADEACAKITQRGKLPVVSGGTGFYLKNFILGLSEAPLSNLEIREQLKKELNEKGSNLLMEELALCDPVSAGRIHINDEYRLLRALEVCRSSGKPLSSFENSSVETRGNFRFITIGLSRPRAELYRRINLRCEEMFRLGLHEEVQSLYKAGYTPDDPGLRAIGYREFFIETYVSKEPYDDAPRWSISKDLEGVQALIAQNSRRYAKRQITFFAGIPDVKWIEVDSSEKIIAQRIREIVNQDL
ncbi:MAG: tRNA (adenosine(37)-N6)-dimethylallyltransferase MiaA [Treponema sp.]|nr:tRNA (adenosine(37)-N6)-dimethylallyltransferase MiaA [Treponema sp.]MCL2251855.1 tRNA (adenosine(37)-N6)-dimethylallyltransferase MiaA [Treponema sp.]